MDGIGRKNLEVPAKRQQSVATLAKQIIYKMTDRLVILSTGIVSCVLLMNRKGITEDNLIKSVNWIAKYILKKGYRIGGINENSSAIAVRNAISYLEEITTKTKKNIFELQISAGEDFQKILMLSYYRNTIVHTFLPEAFVSCALAAFGAQLSTK
jgi:glycerol-3-phosphate O-acyltransferase